MVPDPLQRSRSRPLIIGHRGYPARFPENTLASFEAAILAGCDMIELDVTLTRDRKVVVIHDDTLDRTTNGTGPVRSHRLEEIRRLDAGSWFDPRFAMERVPELGEVLELARNRCLVNIEIKASAFEADSPPDAIEHQVVELVKGSGTMEWVIVSSFDWRLLQRIAAMEHPPALAGISNHGANRRMVDWLLALKAFSWHPRFSALTPAQVALVHAANIKVFPWTITTRKEAEKLLAMGVDGLIGNDPEVLRTLNPSQPAHLISQS